MPTAIEHEPFCTARPGEPGPRIETYRAERSNSDGIVIARPLVTRCQECAAQTVQG